jgi:hypothetical protein
MNSVSDYWARTAGMGSGLRGETLRGKATSERPPRLTSLIQVHKR